MRDEHRYVPGKVAGDAFSRKNCEAEVTWTLKNGRFAMSGGIWEANKRDYIACGQIVDEVADYFPEDIKLQRMRAIWQRWHLNDMQAGSKSQMDWLRANPIPEGEYRYPKSYYGVASSRLAGAGLNPDADGYRYGHAWKMEELPAEVIAEIESWG